MNDLTRAGLSAALTGTVAGITTMTALTLLARAEGRRPLQPINATSHWLHGEEAGEVDWADAPHTLVGFATNHAAAIFWAIPLELWLATQPARPPLMLLRDAAAVSVVAAVVDYGLVPKRLTPGWEDALSPRAVAGGFAALALGLFAGAMLTQELRRGARRPRRRPDMPIPLR